MNTTCGKDIYNVGCSEKTVTAYMYCVTGYGFEKAGGNCDVYSHSSQAIKKACQQGYKLAGGHTSGGSGSGSTNPSPSPSPSPSTSNNSTSIDPGGLPNQKVVGPDAIASILKIVFGIIGALAFLVIVIAGLRYITAAGDPQKTAQAKSTILYALIGLAVAITAQGIVAFVVNRI